MWRQRLTFCILTLLLAGVFFVVLHDIHVDKEAETGEMMRFQQRIGGVGLGAVMVPAWNFFDYDPRLQSVADDSCYPVPGGYSYSPDRLAMVSSFLLAEPPRME